MSSEQENDAASQNPTGSPRPMRRCAGRRNGFVNRSRPRITFCSRCPTPARSSGTWRTPPGSSRRSCCLRQSRITRPSTRATATCSTRTTTRSATAASPGRVCGLLSRRRRSKRCTATVPTSIGTCSLSCTAATMGCASPSLAAAIELGLNHEQQHQELLLTDLKHAVRRQPVAAGVPADLAPSLPAAGGRRGESRTPTGVGQSTPAGVRHIGHAGGGFAFDNETPRHRVFVDAFCSSRIAWRRARRVPRCAFMEAGGYDRPDGWLSDGWQARYRAWQGWTRRRSALGRKSTARWSQFTLDGMRPVPRGRTGLPPELLRGRRLRRAGQALKLPTEAEWETAAADRPLAGSFLEGGRLHPAPAADGTAGQMFGELWQWTASPYVAISGISSARRCSAGRILQRQVHRITRLVLAGSSCATPHAPTSVAATATSSPRTPAGSSPASDSRETHETHRRASSLPGRPPA